MLPYIKQAEERSAKILFHSFHSLFSMKQKQKQQKKNSHKYMCFDYKTVKVSVAQFFIFFMSRNAMMAALLQRHFLASKPHGKKKFLHFTTKGAGTPAASNSCCKIYKLLPIKVL